MSSAKTSAVTAMAAAGMLLPSLVLAQDTTEPSRKVSLTLSPLHLVMPIVEVTGELKIVDHLGASVIVGGGSVSVEDAYGKKTALAAYEGGAQVSVYPLEGFQSLHFGVEALYLYIDASNLEADVTASGEGVAVGPFVGYKLITRGGFTFVGQLGAEYIAARAEAHNTTGTSASKKDSTVIPLLNLNIGWSF